MTTSPADVAARLREIIRSGVFVHKTDPAILTEAAALLDRQAAPTIGAGVEPRGCPTPGACSCPQAAPVEGPRVREQAKEIRRLTTSIAARDAEIAEVKGKLVAANREIDRLMIANKNLGKISHENRARADRLARHASVAKAALIASDHTRAFTEIDAALTQEPT